jgi:hypothetical protein
MKEEEALDRLDAKVQRCGATRGVRMIDFANEVSTPSKEPRCEADKPIGTRDVEKFLREQQDKLWRDD